MQLNYITWLLPLPTHVLWDKLNTSPARQLIATIFQSVFCPNRSGADINNYSLSSHARFENGREGMPSPSLSDNFTSRARTPGYLYGSYCKWNSTILNMCVRVWVPSLIYSFAEIAAVSAKSFRCSTVVGSLTRATCTQVL